MTIRTPNYRLEAFTWGDYYSANVDRRRFTIIDNQLAFVTDIVGEGRILGWSISEDEDEPLTINVSAGMGIIGRTVLESFGVFKYTTENNKVKYVYIKKKEGVVGGTSGYSNINSIMASNIVAPADPSGLAEVGSLRSYNQLAFSWNANTEADFSYYLILRYDDEVYGGLLELGQTTDTTYIDEDLAQDTTYTYQIIAVDLSGNRSGASDITLRTTVDNRIPVAPIFLQIFSGDEFLQAIWDNSPSTTVVEYRVEIQPLDNFGNNSGFSYSIYIDAGREDYGSQLATIKDLMNDEDYRISVYAISYTGVESANVSVVGTPIHSLGSGEVSCADISFEQSQFQQVGIEADVVWNYETHYSDDPYIPDRPYPDKFQIIFVENAGRISEPISLSSSDNRTACEDCNCGGKSSLGGDCFSYHIQFIPYRNNDGILSYESFKEYFPYLLIVKTVDLSGNVSNGVIKRINRTPTSELLSAITNFNIQRQADNSLSITWNNPESRFFDYNLLTINIIDLAGGKDVLYLHDQNVEKITNYIIPSSSFAINKRYVVDIKPIDIFGRSGEAYSGALQFTEEDDDIERPSVPADVTAFNGDKQVTLTWSFNSEDSFVVSYKIYRANYGTHLNFSDFSSVGSVLADQNYFVDNTVINGNSYSYFVVSVDSYGNESYDLTDETSFSAALQVGRPTQSSFFSLPENLAIATDPTNEINAILTWDISVEDFDGYEIFRSTNNSYTFSLVGNTSSSDVSFTDEDGILKDGETYYYMIRKYRNEGDLFVTESTIPPSDAIIIGSVTTISTNDMTIDNTLAIELLNYEEPLRIKTRLRLATHTHKKDLRGDRRIELRSNVFVTDWETVDYRIYITETDIEGAENYKVTVTGTVNEDYFTDENGNKDLISLKQAQAGVCPILYKVEGEEGLLTFNDILYTLCEEPSPDSEFVTLNPNAGPQCPSVPYSFPPVITVELEGIDETSNSLLASKIENLYATQFTDGELNISQVPSVHHDGRIDERLLPLRLPMQTTDNFLYNFAYTYSDNDRNKMGDSVTFYDILKIEDNKILAATSSGIWYSSDMGGSWSSDKKVEMPIAVHRLCKSSLNEYFAVTNYGVYKNDGIDFTVWTKMEGLDYIKSVRDVVADLNGNLYLSTDLGVFRLNRDVPYIEDTWEQLSILGVRSNDAYALLFHSDYIEVQDPSIPNSGRLIVSNELGILQSMNQGRSWIYITDLEVPIKIHSFHKEDDYIYALADKAIYRQNYNNTTMVWTTFDKIAELDVKKSRKIIVFNDRIYITTDEGIKVSLPTSNIYGTFTENNLLEFIPAWANINKGRNIIVTSLNRIDTMLLIGSDRRLFILNNNEKNIWLQYEQENSVIPSVYIDKELQILGFYYNNSGAYHNVSFDEKLNYNSVVEVANKYDIYTAEYGGWVEQKFDASFNLYKNEIKIGESAKEIEVDNIEFTNFTFPTYNDTVSHKLTADSYKAEIQTDIETLTGTTPPEGESLRSLITDIFRNISKFESQLYKSVREDVKLPSIDVKIWEPAVLISSGIMKYEMVSSGTVIYSDDQLVSIGTVDASTGLFIFDSVLDKYDVLTLYIKGCTVKNIGEDTHRELEDTFEEANSGFPSSLSQVQQVNIIKLGLFNEKQWAGRQESLSSTFQANYIIPRDSDVSTYFYDTLNSTVNYKEEVYNRDIPLSLPYVSSVLFIDETNSILVGGKKGVLRINVDTLNISEVVIDDLSNEIVKQIVREGSILYLLTNKNIYKSEDYGLNWDILIRTGLPNDIYSIGFILNNIIVGASDGIYYKASDYTNWTATNIQTTSSVTIFPVSVISDPDLLFTFVTKEENNSIDKDIYWTADGYTFTKMDVVDNFDVTKIVKFGNVIYVATNNGLYADTDVYRGTFYGDNPRLIQVVIQQSPEEDNTINDIFVDNSDEEMYLAMSNGTYYMVENGVFDLKEYTSLSTVHKILKVDGDIWLFGHNLVRVSYLNYPIRL